MTGRRATAGAERDRATTVRRAVARRRVAGSGERRCERRRGPHRRRTGGRRGRPMAGPSPRGPRRSVADRKARGDRLRAVFDTLRRRRSRRRRRLRRVAAARRAREPRLPAGARPRPARGRGGRGRVDHRRRRPPVPRRRGRRDRGERRPRGARGDRRHRGAARARTQYVHGTMFTTGALERYADEVAPLLPSTTLASTRSRAAARRSRPR